MRTMRIRANRGMTAAVALTAALATATPPLWAQEPAPEAEASDLIVEPAPPPAESSLPAEAAPVGLVVFEQGDDRLKVTEGGQEHVQEKSILRVPATGEAHTADVRVM